MKHLNYGDNSSINYENQSIKLNNENGIELLDSNDISSARTLNRPIRNIYENQKENYKLIQTLLKGVFGNFNGVVKNVFEGFDPERLIVGKIKGNNFLRIPTGLLLAHKENPETYSEDGSFSVINQPNINLFERRLGQLIKLDLNDGSNDIKVNCEFSGGVPQYSIKITKNDGEIVNIPKNYLVTENGEKVKKSDGPDYRDNSIELFNDFLNYYSDVVNITPEEQLYKFNCLETIVPINNSFLVGTKYYLYYKIRASEEQDRYYFSTEETEDLKLFEIYFNNFGISEANLLVDVLETGLIDTKKAKLNELLTEKAEIEGSIDFLKEEEKKASIKLNENGSLVIEDENEENILKANKDEITAYKPIAPEKDNTLTLGTPDKKFKKIYGDTVSSSMVHNEDESLIITGLELEKTRKLGHDIGKPYISNFSKVWHFDTDFCDQYGKEDLLLDESLEGSYYLDVDYDPETGISDNPVFPYEPYSDLGKYLRSNEGSAFRFLKELPSVGIGSTDFWYRFNPNMDISQTIYDDSGNSESIQLLNSNGNLVIRYNDQDEEVGSFENNEWIHIGISFGKENINVFVNEEEPYSFTKETTIFSNNIKLKLEMTGTALDELMMDPFTAENNEQFTSFNEGAKKLNFAALDYNEKNFILDANNPDNVYSNVLDNFTAWEKSNSEIKKEKNVSVINSTIFSSVIYANNKFVAVGQRGYIYSSTDGSSWSGGQIPNYSGTFNSVTYGYGNDTFVAVGENGRIYSSTDGISWSGGQVDPNYSGSFNSVTYSEELNKFVVVGNSGTIYYSSDGSSWTKASNTGSYNFTSVTYGNDTFVAVGYNGRIYCSTNGSSWSQAANTGSSNFNSVTYGNDTFVAVGVDGIIYSSTDGGSWTRASNTGSYNFFSVTYGNGTFVAVGRNGTIYYSSDGSSWTKASNTGSYNFTSVTYGNDTFVAVGYNGRIYCSTNGSSWDGGQADSNYSDTFYSVTYGNDTFVAVGVDGNIYHLFDGSKWFKTTLAFSTFTSVIYANNKFVAVGTSGTIYYSADGNSWIGEQVDPEHFTGYFRSITYSEELNTFVAVGENGYIYSSTDGSSWSGGQVDPDCRSFTSVIYGNGTFVAVGSSGTICYSADGSSWSKIRIGSTNFTSVIYANNKFVAVGDLGNIYYSADGNSWSGGQVYPSYSYNFTSVTYGNDTFVAVGENGYIYLSTDGSSWSGGQVDPEHSNWFFSVTYGNDTFVAVGENGYIYYSTDGFSWSGGEVDPNTTFRSVTYGDGTFVAVGTNSRIYYSTNGSNWSQGIVPDYSGTFKSVTYGNGTFVAVGESGCIYSSISGFSWTGGQIDHVFYIINTSPTNIFYGNNRYISGDNYGFLYSDDGRNWTPSNIDKGSLKDAVYINSKWFAVSSSGLYTSEDNGEIWELIKSGNYKKFNYINGKYFIVDSSDVCYCSSDLINWNQVELKVIKYLIYSKEKNGVFYSTTEDGFFSSTDAETWNLLLPGEFYDINLESSKFVVIGSDGIYYSDDGSTWTQSNITSSIKSIVYGNNKFIAMGSDGTVYHSSNGESWYNLSNLISATSIAYCADKFVAISNGIVYFSDDGVSWNSELPIPVGEIVEGSGEQLIINDEGVWKKESEELVWTKTTSLNFEKLDYDETNHEWIGYTSDEIYTSPNAETWTKKSDRYVNLKDPNTGEIIVGYGMQVFPYDFNSITYSEELNTFVAVGGNGAIFYSDDGGSSWSGRQIDSNYSGIFRSVICGSVNGTDTFVAVGDDGAIYYSFDGSSGWNRGQLDHNYSGIFRSVICGLVNGTDTFVAVGDYYGGAAIYYSTNGSNWTKASNTGSYDFYSVTYGNGIFIAVGSSGYIYHSFDGSTWSGGEVDPDYGGNFTSVTYGNGTFVAVGWDGCIYSSTDGNSWYGGRTPDYSDIFTSVTYGNDTFIAVGENGYIYYSDNGISWSGGQVGSYTFNSVIYGNGTFVAVGEGGRTYLSTSGFSWTKGRADPNYSGNFNSVVYGNGKFVAVGSNGAIYSLSIEKQECYYGNNYFVLNLGNYLYKFTNETTWWKKDNISFNNAIYTNGKWNLLNSNTVYISNDDFTNPVISKELSQFDYNKIIKNKIFDNKIFTRDNLNNWNSIGYNGGQIDPNYYFTSVTYGDGTFVAVGDLGKIYYSTDGNSWSEASNTGSSTFNSVTYGAVNSIGTFFIAVGDNGAIYYSEYGSNWTQGIVPDYSGIFKSVTYGSDAFVAVGEGGYIHVSTDGGSSWDGVQVDPDYSGTFNSVTYANNSNTFVAVGADGYIYYSTDRGFSWDGGQVDPDRRSFKSVTYGDVTFVAVGENGAIYYSDNGGSDWIPGSISYTGTLNSVTYGNNKFVAVGEGGYIFSSNRGNIWSGRQVDPNSSTFKSVTYEIVNDISIFIIGIFIAVGDNGAIYYSEYGGSNSWSGKHIGSDSYSLNSVTYGGGRFVVVGDYGVVYNFSDAKYLSVDKVIDYVNNKFIFTKGTQTFIEDSNQTPVSMSVENKELKAINYANNVYVALFDNEIYTSTDGINWGTPKLQIELADNPKFIYDNNIWYLVQDGNIYKSFDNGTTWLLLKPKNILNINGELVAFDNNNIYTSDDGSVWTIVYQNNSVINHIGYYSNFYLMATPIGVYKSTNLTTWSKLLDGDFDIASYANNLYLANGNYGYYYSSDGGNWIRSMIPLPKFTSIVSNNEVFVAISEEGVYNSSDGIVWKEHFTDISFKNIIFGNNKFVAVSNKEVYFSSDGIAWTKSENVINNITDIKYQNNVFVISSSSEGLWFSLDGNEWYQSNLEDFNIKKILCGGNIWLALTNGSIYYSEDGMVWKQSNIEYGECLEFNKTENIYIAGSIDDKGFYYSNNGKKWQHSNITVGNVKAIVCGEDKSIIFTEDGTIWYSNT